MEIIRSSTGPLRGPGTLRRIAVVAPLVLGALLAATPATAASGTQDASLRKEVIVQGPYSTRPECISVQNNYARYYRITRQCWNVGPSGNFKWYFNWEN